MRDKIQPFLFKPDGGALIKAHTSMLRHIRNGQRTPLSWDGCTVCNTHFEEGRT